MKILIIEDEYELADAVQAYKQSIIFGKSGKYK